MGMSTLMAHMILFSVFLSSMYLLYDVFYNAVDEATRESTYQNNRLKEQLETQMGIYQVNYTASTDQLEVYIKNTGENTINPFTMDMYIDRVWVTSTNINYTMLNNSIDPLLWNPGEVLRINTSKIIVPGLHEVKVVTEKGVYESQQFRT